MSNIDRKIEELMKNKKTIATNLAQELGTNVGSVKKAIDQLYLFNYGLKTGRENADDFNQTYLQKKNGVGETVAGIIIKLAERGGIDFNE